MYKPGQSNKEKFDVYLLLNFAGILTAVIVVNKVAFILLYFTAVGNNEGVEG